MEPSATPEPLEVEFDLLEVEGSGISGDVRMEQEEMGLRVRIRLDGTESEAAYPAHIHMGTCDDMGAVLLPLEDVVDGESETMLDGEMLMDYANGDHSVQIRMPDDATVVACGVVPDLTNP